MLPDPIDTGYDVSSDKSGCPRQDRYRDPLLHKIFLFDANRLKRSHAQGLTGIAPQQMAHGRIAGNDDMPDIRHLYPVFAKVFDPLRQIRFCVPAQVIPMSLICTLDTGQDIRSVDPLGIHAA